ncbi:hypothetical protein GCM10009720_09830 [Yaniella flava]|uniref:Uncharacterized protein n=1 Tax=Yaniella flava TaxID=287930 RepID=A0ABN2U9G6_9MICC
MWFKISGRDEKALVVIIAALLAGAIFFTCLAARSGESLGAVSIAFVYASLAFTVFIEIRNTRASKIRDKTMGRIEDLLKHLRDDVGDLNNEPVPVAPTTPLAVDERPDDLRVKPIVQVKRFVVGRIRK